MPLTEILAPDGSTIYVQCNEQASDELQAVSFLDDIGKRTEKFKETLLGTIRGYSQMVLNAVEEGLADSAPEKVSLEFGLHLGGKAGVPFVTEGSAQANVKVTVEWNLSERKQGG
jgi:hypothetical protein